MSSEEWLPVVGYENHYEVSDQGNVRSVARVITRSDGKVRRLKSVLLKHYKLPSGYVQVTLSVDNLHKKHYIHRLVACSHIPNAERKVEVNHLDGDKSYNCKTNLEWCTSSENNLHAHATGLMKNKTGKGNYNFKGAIQAYDKNGNTCFTLDGPVSMRERGLTPTTVYKCLSGKAKTHKGYTFKRIVKEK